MTKFTVKLNKAKMSDIIFRSMGKSPAIKRAAYKAFFAAFSKAKRGMLKEFDRHPVTQEIEAGPLAENISDTLGGGYGNLFAFIGFSEGADPTKPLRDVLDVGTDFTQTTFRRNVWYFKINTPNRKAIVKATPMEWEQGNSWAEGIEHGIGGLSHFMYKHNSGSRSKEGFQLPYENLSNIAFKPKPYLTEILANFRERINDSKGIL